MYFYMGYRIKGVWGGREKKTHLYLFWCELPWPRILQPISTYALTSPRSLKTQLTRDMYIFEETL